VETAAKFPVAPRLLKRIKGQLESLDRINNIPAAFIFSLQLQMDDFITITVQAPPPSDAEETLELIDYEHGSADHSGHGYCIIA
jgi:hypothetical protein